MFSSGERLRAHLGLRRKPCVGSSPGCRPGRAARHPGCRRNPARCRGRACPAGNAPGRQRPDRLAAARGPVSGGSHAALVARDVATAFLTGYNGSSAAADTIAWYSNALFPVGNTLHLSFPLMESFNPALWSLCLQTLGSLITVILIAARRMGPLLWGALFVAAAACLALTPVAAMLVGHLVARVRLTRDPTASLALMVPVLFVGAYLCLVPFGPFSPALSEICASPWLSLTACADPGHLLKIAGVSVISAPAQ